MKFLTISALFSLALAAQPADKPVSDKVAAKFWRAQAQAVAAKAEADAKLAAFIAAKSEAERECGTGQLMDDNGLKCKEPIKEQEALKK